MIKLFTALRDLLREQLQVAAKMLEVGQAQCEALKKADIPALNKAVKEMEKKSPQLAALEKNRLEIQQKMEQGLHLPPGGTLSGLLPFGPEEIVKDLKDLLTVFQDEVVKIQALNETNRLLAQNGLYFNQYLFKALRPVKNHTYQGSGQIKKQEGLSLLNRTV